MLGGSGASASRRGKLNSSMEAAMTSLASYAQAVWRSRGREENFGKDHSINYIIAFAALGMFVSLMAVALGLDGLAW